MEFTQVNQRDRWNSWGGGAEVRLAHQQQILGPLVPVGEELYQSWDGRGDEVRDSWDHLFLDASWWRYQSAEGRGEPMTPTPSLPHPPTPLQLLSETFPG